MQNGLYQHKIKPLMISSNLRIGRNLAFVSLIMSFTLMMSACDDDNGGEDMAGEGMAGEGIAGEGMAGESMAGESMADGSYQQDAPMNSLNESGQQEFCETFVTRNQEADAATSESDRMRFKEKSCLLAGLFGGATDEAGCEADRLACLMEFETAMFTVESCLTDFADAFASCGANVSDIESCEMATREILLSSILALNTGLYSCGNTGEPSLFLLAAGLPTEPPAECAIDSVAMCQE